MSIVIDPIPWVEGDSKLVINTRNGVVSDVVIETYSIRGYDYFTRGRHVELLPSIVSSICGLTSWSHYTASLKALDMIYGRKIPRAAETLRLIGLLIEVLEDNMLFIGLKNYSEYGNESLPSKYFELLGRIGVLKEVIGGRTANPVYGLAGGVSYPPSKIIDKLEKSITSIRADVSELYTFFKNNILDNETYRRILSDEFYLLPENTGYLALISDGEPGYYDGGLLFSKKPGEAIEYDVNDYISRLRIEHLNRGFAKTIELTDNTPILTGSIARYNLSGMRGDGFTSEYDEIKSIIGKPVKSLAGIIGVKLYEILYVIDRIEEIISDREAFSGEYMVYGGKKTNRGIGVVDSSRGVIIHSYSVDEKLVATNTLFITPSSMKLGFLKHFIKEGIIGREYSAELRDKMIRVLKFLNICFPASTHMIILRGGHV